MRAKIVASGMGFLFLGLGSQADINRNDDEHNQGDYGLAKSKNANQQIEYRDTGENGGKPSHEDCRFVHNISGLLFVCFSILLESQRYSKENLNSLRPVLSPSFKIAV